MIFVEMYLTEFATNWCIPSVIWYNICIDIIISEMVVFKQLRHAMQGRTTQNKQIIYTHIYNEHS